MRLYEENVQNKFISSIEMLSTRWRSQSKSGNRSSLWVSGIMRYLRQQIKNLSCDLIQQCPQYARKNMIRWFCSMKMQQHYQIEKFYLKYRTLYAFLHWTSTCSHWWVYACRVAPCSFRFPLAATRVKVLSKWFQICVYQP